MFDRFSERARKSMSLAWLEALRLRHESIGTEHMLIGLAAKSTGLASRALQSLGADVNRVRA